MQEAQLFSMALGLQEPWFVEHVHLTEFTDKKQELHIHISHTSGVRFAVEGESCPVYDHVDRMWRHLDFFQHECYIHARVPRVLTQAGHVLQVEVPWSYPGSSFTLLFEALVRMLARNQMSMSAIGRYLNIGDRVATRIITRAVYKALQQTPIPPPKLVGIDETSYQKGHQYITLLTNIENKQVVGIGFGKDGAAANQALAEMEFRGGCASAIEAICMDMSPAYIAFADDRLPQADRVFDRFHIQLLLNKAVDQVRRQESKQATTLKHTRFLWLKKGTSLNAKSKTHLAYLAEIYPTLGEAYRLKELFADIWKPQHTQYVHIQLRNWLSIALQSGIQPIQEFASMCQRHIAGLYTYFKYRITNGIIENINGTIQMLKRIARGYRNPHHLKLMIYFHLGQLNLDTHN